MAFAKAYKVPDVQTFPRSEQIAPSSRSTISSRKKSARELRQRRSDYRCCIPALAGFVSPQSIAPDGGKTFAQDHHRATATRETDNDIVTSLRIDSTSCIWLHRRREMARALSLARFGMLLHYDRQPARPLQPAAVARTRLAPANNDNDHDNDTQGRGFAAIGIPLMRSNRDR